MRSFLLFLLLVAGGCGSAAREVRAEARLAPARLPAIVLVTIDGVRAGDVFAHPERLPALHALMARGVGLALVASGPRYVSLPGYREILTGRRNDSCADNRCPTLREATILDELRAAGGLGVGDVVTIGSWETIARAASTAPASLSISVGRHGGPTRALLAVNGAAVRDLDEAARARAFPGHDDYRADALTARLALDVLSARAPRAAWIALGDTDEHAHRGDYEGYLRALAAADEFLGQLLSRIDLDDAIVIVTSDHGRSANFRDHGDSPESSGTWLVAAGRSIPHLGRVSGARTHRLADIAPTLRALLQLPPDLSPRAGAPIPELLDGSGSAAQLAAR